MEPISYILATMLPLIALSVWIVAKKTYVNQSNGIIQSAEKERSKILERAKEEAKALEKEKLL